MPEDILSPEELEALLATVEEDGGRRRRERIINEYDFVRPNKLSGDQVRSLQHMHETIAQNLTMVLSTYLRVNLEVTLISLGQLNFDVFRSSLPNPTIINILNMDPLEERSILTMDMKLAFSLIDRMLGGAGKALNQIRNLTTIEQSLIDNVTTRFIEGITKGWERLFPFRVDVEAREMDPQFIQVIPSSEMVMVVTFSLQAPGEIEAGEMCFCIPFISLDPIMGDLGDSFQFASAHRVQSPAQEQHLRRVVDETTLPLEMRLGETDVTIEEILALETDDVLVLDQLHDQPLQGYIGDELRLTARAGKIGRKIGVVVEDVLPDEPFGTGLKEGE